MWPGWVFCFFLFTLFSWKEEYPIWIMDTATNCSTYEYENNIFKSLQATKYINQCEADNKNFWTIWRKLLAGL